MTWRSVAWCRGATLLFVVLCACNEGSVPPTRRALTDAIGRKVELGVIRRVVSLAPSSTEIVYALGAGDLLVGVDRFSDYPTEVHGVPQVGSDMEPNIERIVALRPDLVLVATSANAQRSVDNMARVSLPVYVSRADSLEAIFRDIEGIGRALDREARARALVRGLRERLARITDQVRGRPPTPCAVIVWPAPLVVAAAGNHVTDLLVAAGGVNVIDDSTQPFPSYSTERLIAKAPQVLLAGTHATGAPSLEPLERLGSIPAVRDHRVHLVDGDLLFRPGPRVIDGTELLLGLLHPELGNGDGGAR